MQVEIVVAQPDRQVLERLEIEEGATVGDVIRRSRIARHFPGIDLGSLQTGVWGRPVDRDHRVVEGDRVELYRPLEIDPKEARRLKAGG